MTVEVNRGQLDSKAKVIRNINLVLFYKTNEVKLYSEITANNEVGKERERDIAK